MGAGNEEVLKEYLTQAWDYIVKGYEIDPKYLGPLKLAKYLMWMDGKDNEIYMVPPNSE